MTHVDFDMGVYYPLGGMTEIVQALVKVGTELGVTYHLNSPVTEIITLNGKATGIKTPTGSVAPSGHENIFIFVPIPARLEDTPEIRQSYAKKILATIRTTCNIPDFEKKLVYQKTFSLKDFSERYNCLGGSSLGLAHTLMQTAIFRPNNISKKTKQLYYVGANTNPGIGLPMCLISAELVYKRITQHIS